jgi:hypothetical protein
MRPLGWTVLLASLLAIGLIGLASWAYAHQGYPNIVYYQEDVITTTGTGAWPTYRLQRWIDPQRRIMRVTWSQNSDRAIRLVRDGRAYSFDDTLPPDGWTLPPDRAQSIEQLYDDLEHGDIGAALLAHEVGPITRARLDGHPALRFATSEQIAAHGPGTRRIIAWIDARSHALLQVQTVYADRTVTTDRYLRAQRLPPGSLPRGYFTLTRGHSAWEQGLGWIRDRLGMSH